MSEFLAEAQVLIRPNTATFRAELEAQLAAATARPLTVPITPVSVGPVTTGAVTAATQAQSLAASQATSANAALRIQLQELTAVLAANTTAANANALAMERLGAADALAGRGAASATNRIGQIEKAAFASAAGLTGLRGAVLTAGTAFLGATVAIQAFGRAITGFADFERQLAVFAATAGATNDEMEKVSATAKQLGADITLPGVSASDAAEAMTSLARAGLTVEDSLAGARGVLQLSTAAQIDAAQAAELAASALNAFGLAGDQATRVADVLANAANQAQGSIEDFGLAFRQSSAVARQVGFSLEETAAQLTILARAGLRGSDAGTSLRVALLRLVNPTEKAAKVIADLNIQLRDAQGNIRPDVFVQFGEATENFTPKMRDAAFATVFGADAIRTVSIAAREGREELARTAAEVSRQGTASELAAAQTAGLAGQAEALKNTLATLGVEMGSVAAIAAGPLLSGLQGVAEVVRISISPLLAFTKILDQLSSGGFDPASASSAEFLKELDKQLDSVADNGDAFLRIAASRDRLVAAAKGSIASLEAERAQLRALGQDTSGIDELIAKINAELDRLGLNKGAALAAAQLTPLQKSAVFLEEAIAGIGGRFPAVAAELRRELKSVRDQLLLAANAAPTLKGELELLTDRVLDFSEASNRGAGGAKTLAAALKELQTEATRAKDELLRLQTEGGTPQEQISVLQQENVTQREIIAEAQRRGGKGAATAIREARAIIKGNLAEIESLQREITSDAEDAANRAEDERDRQDDAFLRLLDAATRPLDRALARANLTDTLADNIKFTTDLIALYKSQIAQAKKRVQDAETRNRIVKDLEDKLFQAILDRQRLQRENRQRIQDALEERQERIQAGIRLDIELADIQENTKRSIALRLRLIAQLKKEARILKLHGNALKENRNERARLRKEIQDLLDEADEDQNLGAQLNFRILQQAQGFATTILSNLIPAAATTGALAGPPIGAQANQLPDTLRQDAAVSVATQQGVTRGQGNETNSILRDILRQLETLNGRTTHPEATRQRRIQSGSMDTVAL